MICVVCMKDMTPYYHHICVPGAKLARPFLAGFKCEYCRDMLSKQFDGSSSLKEITDYQRWQDQYDYAIEKYADLPQGYSFP